MGGLSFQKGKTAASVPQDDIPSRDATPVTPPKELAVAALASALIGAAALLRVSRLWHLIGYIFSSLLTIGLVAAFRRTDARRRRSGYYSPKPPARRAIIGAAIIGVLAAAAHAWYLARLLG